MRHGNPYDHVVIGGGTAGCVAAARLAAAGRKVALIEAGPLAERDENILNLGRWRRLIGGPLDYDLAIEPSRRGNSRLRHPRGRVLGGTGSLNTCIAFIPPASDFSRWEAAGASGWSAQALEPFFARALTTLGCETATLANPLNAAFVAAAQQAGLARADFSGARWQAGAGAVSFNRRGDRRRSTAIAYLLPLAQWGERLQLCADTRALRLLIDGGRVCGVATDKGEFRAEGEVILCAGAFHTPQLLLVSGVGPALHLREHGIPVQMDLPGVGENLQDHVETSIGWETEQPPPPNDIPVWQVALFASLETGAEAQVMMHMGPNLNDEYALAAGYDSAAQGFSLTPNVMYPRSRGRITLRSADPADSPRIDFRYFEYGGADESLLVGGLRLAREIARQPALRPWITREAFPGPGVTSDAALGEYARRASGTSYHPVGTCRMGAADDERAVVDPELRLRGLDNLRVADASVFPLQPGVNPNLTIAMLAERCAEWLLRG